MPRMCFLQIFIDFEYSFIMTKFAFISSLLLKYLLALNFNLLSLRNVRAEKVRAAMNRMKTGKAVGPDDIPVEAWRCLGELTVNFLTRLFNKILEDERIPDEWKRSVLVPIFKNKGDVQSCSNYRGIKLISHTMELWERVVEARLGREVTISEQQYGFMPRKTTTDAMFALRVLMEKYREGQKELHNCIVFLWTRKKLMTRFQKKSCGIV